MLIAFEVVVGFTLVRWFVKCMSEYLLVVPIRWLIGSFVSLGSTMSSHFVNTLVSDGMLSTVSTSEERFTHLLVVRFEQDIFHVCGQLPGLPVQLAPVGLNRD